MFLLDNYLRWIWLQNPHFDPIGSICNLLTMQYSWRGCAVIENLAIKKVSKQKNPFCLTNSYALVDPWVYYYAYAIIAKGGKNS